MSWQTYIDEQLLGQGLVQAAILGHDGGVWASSQGFGPKGKEASELAAFKDTPSKVFSGGITFNGVKYMGIKGEGSSVYGKKGAGGIVVVFTTQTIVIGVYDEKVQPGVAAVIVEKLGDYLRENSY